MRGRDENIEKAAAISSTKRMSIFILTILELTQ